MLRLGWFSTGRGEGSRAFLNLVHSQIETGVLDARIEFVFSNRGRGEADGSDQFFELVEGYGLPLVTLSSQQYRLAHGGGPMSRHRETYHGEVMRLISGFSSDLCVLAGYMLITSPEMCRQYSLINLHPALPGGPAGTWQQVIWDLIAQKAAQSGAMIHVATEVLDSGPVVSYCSFPIRGGGFDSLWREVEGRSIDQLKAEGEQQALFQEIRRSGMRREGPLLLETLKSLAAGRWKISGGQVLDASWANAPGIRLNEAVERYLQREGA